MSALPRITATWRDRIAVGTNSRLMRRICSPKPGITRSATASVASGVTSRGAGPVPPVVTTRWQPRSSTSSRSVASMTGCSSGIRRRSSSRGLSERAARAIARARECPRRDRRPGRRGRWWRRGRCARGRGARRGHGCAARGPARSRSARGTARGICAAAGRTRFSSRRSSTSAPSALRDRPREIPARSARGPRGSASSSLAPALGHVEEGGLPARRRLSAASCSAMGPAVDVAHEPADVLHLAAPGLVLGEAAGVLRWRRAALPAARCARAGSADSFTSAAPTSCSSSICRLRRVLLIRSSSSMPRPGQCRAASSLPRPALSNRVPSRGELPMPDHPDRHRGPAARPRRHGARWRCARSKWRARAARATPRSRSPRPSASRSRCARARSRPSSTTATRGSASRSTSASGAATRARPTSRPRRWSAPWKRPAPSRATPPRTRPPGLPDAERLFAGEPPDLDLFHPWGLSVEEAIEIARRSEAAALAVDRRITNSEGATRLGLRHAISSSPTRAASSAGFPNSRRASAAAWSPRTRDGMQRDDWYTSERDPRAPGAPEAWAASRRARGAPPGSAPDRHLGSRRCCSRRASRAASSGISSRRRAARACTRSSFLLDSLGKPVFSPEHRHPRGSAPAQARWQRLVRRRRRGDRAAHVVEGGVLQGLVPVDATRRASSGIATTGNAGGNHNLIVEAGRARFRRARCERMGRGFVVTELMGQGINTVTGDYSRGAAGFWVEDGEIRYPGAGGHHRRQPARHVQGHRRRSAATC